MILRDVFYILGSIFFGVTVVLVFLVTFYLIRILRDLFRVSSTVRDLSASIREKVEIVSGVLALGYGLLKRLTKIYSQRKKKKVEKEKK